MRFNDLSGRAFIEAPYAMWRPELYKRVERNKRVKNRHKTRIRTKNKTHNHHLKTYLHILDTFANVAFDNVLNFEADLVISSAVVTGPPVECRCPIRWTEGWMTRFQGRGCYDIQ